MFTHVRSIHVFALLGLLGVSSGSSFGAGNRPIDPALPVLTADDPDSVATIVGPWEEPLHVRVITLSDLPVVSSLVSDQRDASEPVRIATTISAPTGEPVHINIVEIGRRTIRQAGEKRDSQRNVEWIVNTDLAFTADAELAAALQGVNIRQPRGLRQSPPDEATVVEIFVWYDPNTDRSVRPNYGIQIITLDGHDGVNEFDPPTGDAGQGGDDLGDGPPEEGDGGDPIGSPDRSPSKDG